MKVTDRPAEECAEPLATMNHEVNAMVRKSQAKDLRIWACVDYPVRGSLGPQFDAWPRPRGHSGRQRGQQVARQHGDEQQPLVPARRGVVKPAPLVPSL